jgi:pyruvate-ferredoxin/flavodoxin oxidoreductase
LDEKELAGAPEGTLTKKAIGKQLEGLQFRIQVSTLDCTGCGNCADVCPAKNKALIMKPIGTQEVEIERWNYISKNVTYKDTLLPKEQNVKNSQFAQPLFEFSGACAGCGETPYLKLITQLYGDRMIIANATGCSSIYGGSSPSTPYTTNACGKGPAWGNSLFEDNAEFGYGIATGVETMRDRLERLMQEAISTCTCCTEELKKLFGEWIANRYDAVKTEELSKQIIPLVQACDCKWCKDIYDLRQYLIKKSIWIFGGDGWSYDIGFGGLDHVLASGKDVNVVVLDTEVYSNTGGQASKSTPIGAVAKFASSGKRIRKKDLGMIAMTYGYVYVAQVAMGASQAQYFKAIKEAESYPGPSLIIAYAPCINHGLKFGMGKSQAEEKEAVECGYWHTYRFDPRLEAEGKNPFQLDSKEPDWSKFQEFLMNQVRYSSLKKLFPEEAGELFQAAQENALWRYRSYQRMASMNYDQQ